MTQHQAQMIARLTRIARPDTLDPTNVDRHWPDNAPSEPILCRTCERDVKDEGDQCWECQVSAAEYAPDDEMTARGRRYYETQITTISQ